MVRPVVHFYCVQDLQTASVFNIDGCVYLHAKETIYFAKHKSLADWIESKPVVRRRLEFLKTSFDGSDDWRCSWCRCDQHACICEVNEDGLIINEYGIFIPGYDETIPF